jgi:predicted DCC family thiol-disulfide oxidoreductase YuxK
MPDKPQFPIRVFYDGSCSVCAREMEHYLRRQHGGRIVVVDIIASDFDPEPWRISREAFLYELHVIGRKGSVYRGVDAFWAIWQAFPASSRYGLLGFFINLPVVNPLARLVYKGFARIRKYLPERSDCGSGACKIGRKGS